MNLNVRYDEEVDILTVDTGRPIAISSSIDFGLVADYGSEESCDVVGIEIMSAGKLIAPFCAVNYKDFLALKNTASMIKSLDAEYDKEADVLKISTTRNAEFQYEVSDELTACLGYEDSACQDTYDMVGFELRNASELLSPYFKLNRAPLITAGGNSG